MAAAAGILLYVKSATGLGSNPGIIGLRFTKPASSF